jgi:hypothetical protein
VDVETVTERDGFARLEVRRDLGAIEVTLLFIRNEDHHHVRPRNPLGRVPHREIRRERFRCRSRPVLQADHHLDPAVAKVLGMGVALASVSDDRDLLGTDALGLGVCVVIDLHRLLAFLPSASWTVDVSRLDGAREPNTNATPGPPLGTHRRKGGPGTRESRPARTPTARIDGQPTSVAMRLDDLFDPVATAQFELLQTLLFDLLVFAEECLSIEVVDLPFELLMLLHQALELWVAG